MRLLVPLVPQVQQEQAQGSITWLPSVGVPWLQAGQAAHVAPDSGAPNWCLTPVLTSDITSSPHCS